MYGTPKNTECKGFLIDVLVNEGLPDRDLWEFEHIFDIWFLY